MAEVKKLEGKEYRLAEDIWLIDSIEELDKFATTFNYMYKIKRDHLLRIEDINNGVYVLGKLHNEGWVELKLKEDGEI